MFSLVKPCCQSNQASPIPTRNTFVRKSGKPYKFVQKGFNMKDLLLLLAAFSSAAGIVFLTFSVVNIIQIRIGVLSCGSDNDKEIGQL